MNTEELIRFCLTATEEDFFLRSELLDKLQKEEAKYLKIQKELLEEIEKLKYKYLACNHPIYSTINDERPRYIGEMYQPTEEQQKWINEQTNRRISCVY